MIVNLPLWEPSTVQLGDVGYLSKPSGQFVTLFNALKPPKSAGGPKIAMASMAGYGSISKGRKCKEKRNAAQKGLDMFSELLTFRSKGEASTAYVKPSPQTPVFVLTSSPIADDILSDFAPVINAHIFMPNQQSSIT